MSAGAISVVMRSMNDARLIRGTLRSLHGQEYDGRIEVTHIDSGSSDGTVDIIREFGPNRLIEILPSEYIPGVVLNRGMRETDSDWVVFLNSDAEPADRWWLAELLGAVDGGGKVGAAFSRQIPRTDCRAVFAHDYDRCFGPERESASWDHFFSMVSCIVNRSAWEEHPFREDLQYAEDDEWSRRLKAHGWDVVYAEKSLAIHSHNYTLKQSYRRCYGDMFAHAATKPDQRLGSLPGRLVHDVVLAGMKDASRDLAWCLKNRRLAGWPHACAVRITQRLGKTIGFRNGWRHYHRGEGLGA